MALSAIEDVDPTEVVRSVLDEDERKHRVEVHAWEGAIEKTWDKLRLDEFGKLQHDELLTSYERKRKLDGQTATADDRTQVYERGLVRNLALVVDMSESMVDEEGGAGKTTTNPYGLVHVKDAIETFIREFFAQNPVSQLGVIFAHDGKAQRISDISSNPEEHVIKFREASSHRGVFSLQNAIMVAGQRLVAVAPQGNKEILVVTASLSTIDPGDIFESIALLASKEIRCSVVGFNAEVYIYKFLAEKTRGTYRVVQSARDLELQLQAHVPPPALPKLGATTRTRKWLQMGFPDKIQGTSPTPCACHGILSYVGYMCPRCGAKSCTVPSTCSVCQLMLAYSSSLARSYHHLFPPLPYDIAPETQKLVAHAQLEQKLQNEQSGDLTLMKMDQDKLKEHATKRILCYGCNTFIPPADAVVCVCPGCERSFCLDCDELVHESLFTCPGCAALPKLASSSPLERRASMTSTGSGVMLVSTSGPVRQATQSPVSSPSASPSEQQARAQVKSELGVKAEPGSSSSRGSSALKREPEPVLRPTA